ncbi:ankyrin repeat domain-containing protein SOWAHA-like isoform X2 [Syngnathoides biaculeatus]|uniref:ankyrin repeat domain-containing protein SOWAHA-like isoform X2 n=1 Tax=Syngnathoides biaculeatus TaxID=300417 RepID=UPI002ADE115C|nr:ankyrin repeat domain-containing protein SOWAHA-like isoform X2 [Syngnathoides biaculeatus]
MDTDFTQESVLLFLQSRGGSVKNCELLLNFRGFLRDHPDQVRNRELFKKFVNSVATVKQEHGVSHVVLKKKFRPPGTAASGTSTGKPAEPPPAKATLNPARGKEKIPQKPFPRNLKEVTAAVPIEPDLEIVLPVAGIIRNNNNVSADLKVTLQATRAEAFSATSHAPISAKFQPRPQGIPEHPAIIKSICQGGTLKASVQHGGSSQQVSPPESRNSNPSMSLLGLHAQARRPRYRQSYKTAVSYDEDDDEDEGFKMKLSTSGGVRPLSGLLEAPARSNMCQPVLSSPPEHMLPKNFLQNVAGGQVLQSPPGWSLDAGLQLRRLNAGTSVVAGSPPRESMSTRRSLPSECSVQSRDRAEEEERRSSLDPGFASAHSHGWSPKERTWLSSSHNSIFSFPSDAAVTVSGRTSTTEKQHLVAGNLQDNWAAPARVAPFHHSSDHPNQRDEPRGVSWHHSSTLRQRPTVARHVSSKLKGRMCRSMGADLNRLLQEEEAVVQGSPGGNEAARRSRLHRISSSLSLPYNLSSSSLSSCSTPSRCNSLADLAERPEAKGKFPPVIAGAHHESPNRQSAVPLEPREHTWLVKGASGAWPDIYSLFREDATLLNRRDFISGFTVLHWIAKHGDHRVLNTLWYGVQKAGLAFDINARSSCGQTPLHIAAIHGNKNMIRLLVNKFDADVKLRDTAGKKPWQYLSRSAPSDVFHMLGAPTWNGRGGQGGIPVGEHPSEQKPRHHRRHRRHHLSFANSDERPRTVSGVKVKRSSSIAAFLKHKSLARFHGYKSDG